MEDNINRRQHQWKTNSMNKELKGRTPLWNNILMEALEEITLACLAIQFVITSTDLSRKPLNAMVTVSAVLIRKQTKMLGLAF